MQTTYNPNNMVNNFDTSSYPYQPSQQQTQTQTQTIVPATAPGKTIYSNYAVPSRNDDLIDLGDSMSTGYGSTYSSQQSTPTQTTTDDLISFDSNNVSFAMSPTTPPATTTTNHDDILKALQDRDDEFIRSLPLEVIEEQKRIISQIQESNRSTNNNSQLVSHTPNQTGLQRYEQKFDALPEVNEASLPKEVHPKKYPMKTERKVKTAASATAGAVIGGLILAPIWPVGAAAGAVVGGYAGKVVSRSGERKQQCKWDKRNFNKFTAEGHCDVQSENVTFA